MTEPYCFSHKVFCYGLQEFRAPIAYGRSEWIYEEADIALMAVGSMVKTAEQVRDALKDTGYNCTLINARFVKPIDEQMLEEVAKQHKLLVTLEENVRNGGFGDHVLEYVNDEGVTVREEMKPEMGDYGRVYDALYQTITNGAPNYVKESEVLTNLEILERGFEQSSPSAVTLAR